MPSKTTGRYETREELEMFVWRWWDLTPLNQSQIARACHVSEGTVANILKGQRPTQQSEERK